MRLGNGFIMAYMEARELIRPMERARAYAVVEMQAFGLGL